MSYQTALEISELIQTFNKNTHEFKSYDDLGHWINPKVSLIGGRKGSFSMEIFLLWQGENCYHL